jgi:rod shape-determining protein MreC
MLRELLARYRQTLLLTLALVLPVGSMYFHGKTRTETSLLERALLTITSPVTGAGNDLIIAGRDLVAGYVMLTHTETRNRDLEHENRILLGEALKSRAQADELHRVKQLCGFREERKDLATLPARVVGRDVSQFFQVVRLTLDVEGAQGVREGQSVITHDGVVGHIERVSGGHADVMLVTDTRSQVHATIPGKGVIGSVHGKGKRNEFEARFVYLDRVDRTVPIRAGDAVLTTGHDRIFPPGLEIGHIAEGAAIQNGPYHEFVLAPAVSYATLEEVLIVTGFAAPPTPADTGKPASRVVDPANTPDGPP